jgi:hypothetical protein
MYVNRIRYYGREATVLENEKIRTVIDDVGGMVPELSIKRGKGALNAHWIPDFRSNSGQPWDAQTHKNYWKGKLLYNLAGDFPCSPNFGPDCTVDGVSIPAHGWTANERWNVISSGKIEEKKIVYAGYRLQSPDQSLPLIYEKYDLLRGNDPSYYSIMSIANHGTAPIAINIAHHNTVGSAFLQAGCTISLCAKAFMTPPWGSEFDETGRLLVGAQFENLEKAPTREGGLANLRVVPGIIGYTDFVTGAVPRDASLGWSCVVNAQLKIAYVSFFPGPRAIAEDEISLCFNDLWMQYGGRNFTPWALHDGGADKTFCLGAENAIGAFANGLEYSRVHPELLNAPTIEIIPAKSKKKLLYGTALIELEEAFATKPIVDIVAEEEALVLKTATSYQRVSLDASFSALRSLE